MFNIESFDIKLNTEFIGRNFIYADEIDSTNKYLMNKEGNQNNNGTVVLAEKQTHGKGRKDRVWYSTPDSNLTFSILLNKDKFLLKNSNLINFAASLAVANAIENLYQLKTELKWPNDVLINSKKTCGILIEASSQANKIDKLVLGIGVNVNQSSFQGTFNYPPTSIKIELGRNVERERLLAEILNILEELFEKLKKDKVEVLNDWKSKCRMIGEKISIKEDEKEKFGMFYDIDEDGFLILETRDGKEKIHFGDVTLG